MNAVGSIALLVIGVGAALGIPAFFGIRAFWRWLRDSTPYDNEHQEALSEYKQYEKDCVAHKHKFVFSPTYSGDKKMVWFCWTCPIPPADRLGRVSFYFDNSHSRASITIDRSKYSRMLGIHKHRLRIVRESQAVGGVWFRCVECHYQKGYSQHTLYEMVWHNLTTSWRKNHG